MRGNIIYDSSLMSLELFEVIRNYKNTILRFTTTDISTLTTSHLLKVQGVSQEADVVLVAAGKVEEDGQPGVVLQVTVNVEVKERGTVDPEDACDKGAQVHGPCGVRRQVPSEVIQKGKH